MPTFLITSATGRQGGSTARLLLAQGAKVHALVRDTTSLASLALQSLGATLFKGDFEDVPGITRCKALADVTTETRAAENFVAAARAAGTVTSFIVSTVYGANRHADWSVIKSEFPIVAQFFESKADVERVIRASGFTYTILRPGWLMHNYIGPASAYLFPEYVSARVLSVSNPRAYRMGHLDAADVGQFAAAALLDPARFAGEELELTNERLTFDEVAAHLSTALGAEVTVKYRTDEETAAARKAFPPLETHIRGLTVEDIVDDTKLAQYGFHLTTFKEFLEREKSAVRKTVGIEA
ncbi:NAD(P)-binding protein [Mycena rosella]|uniref:NAD(P)-binding protein n=1 Tax=Mycena rosella TaxID=1033263 RepID=A0AAD7DJK6_MYCRO|nr:NAD(P)-binding protein [Mycena rosella]